MATNTAVVVESPGKAVLQQVPYPSLPADDYLLVKPTAVAINPTDWKHVHNGGEERCDGCTLGFDYAGVVEEVGPGVTKDFKKGDRIAGIVHGANIFDKRGGAFARYTTARQFLQSKVPDNLTDEEAASQGVAMATIGLSLYKCLQLPWPTKPAKEPFHIFIYGGTTAMGISAIQMAKLSGGTVITTSSPSNADYLRSLGADHILDYKSESIVEDVVSLTGGTLIYAMDCHSDEASSTICAKVLKGKGARLVSLLFVNDFVRAVNPKLEHFVPMGYSVFGDPYVIQGYWTPNPRDYEMFEAFAPLYWDLLAQGKLKPPKLYVNRGGSGLEGVINGLEELKQGKVRAGKLVYTL